MDEVRICKAGAIGNNLLVLAPHEPPSSQSTPLLSAEASFNL